MFKPPTVTWSTAESFYRIHAIVKYDHKVEEKRLLWLFQVSEMSLIKDQEITAHKLYFDMQNDF